MQLGNVRISPRLIFIGFLVLFLVTILASIVPFPNDDTYVYFNYARNFVAGRPFAYDARNIPSEGFTSLFYLLLLIPFEALHVNMAFVSIALNILALFILIGLGAAVTVQMLGTDRAVPFCIIFAGFAVLDANIVPIAAHGLETLFNPASVLAAAYLLARCCDRANLKRSRDLHLFFALTFLSFLIRPENLLVVGICGGLVLLVFYSQRRQVILDGLLFGVALVIYEGLTYLIFKDWFPTGFYRKVGDSFLGETYILNAVVDYLPWLIGGLMLGTITLRKSRVLFKHPVTLFLGLAAITTLVFFSHTNPLVGYNDRFLIDAMIALLFFISLMLVYWIGTRWRYVLYGLALVIFARTIWVNIGTSDNPTFNPNLYTRTVSAVDQIVYIRFGTYLREHLPDHEQMTLVFGDAGIFPYAFQSRFVDADGLAEAYLAHLFRLPDGVEKAQDYSDYILSWKPDIIIMGFGAISADGTWTPPANPHSPFQQPQPLSVFARFRDYGMEYACSVKSIYDLHITVWKDSPYHDEILKTLRDYCSPTENGYTLPNGFVVEENGDTVAFPLAS